LRVMPPEPGRERPWRPAHRSSSFRRSPVFQRLPPFQFPFLLQSVCPPTLQLLLPTRKSARLAVFRADGLILRGRSDRALRISLRAFLSEAWELAAWIYEGQTPVFPLLSKGTPTSDSAMRLPGRSGRRAGSSPQPQPLPAEGTHVENDAREPASKWRRNSR